jgi:hypothetical protein
MQEPLGMLRRTIDLLTASLPTGLRLRDGTLYEGFAAKMDKCLEASLSATLVVSGLRRAFVKAEVAARNTNARAAAS